MDEDGEDEETKAQVVVESLMIAHQMSIKIFKILRMKMKTEYLWKNPERWGSKTQKMSQYPKKRKLLRVGAFPTHFKLFPSQPLVENHNREYQFGSLK